MGYFETNGSGFNPSLSSKSNEYFSLSLVRTMYTSTPCFSHGVYVVQNFLIIMLRIIFLNTSPVTDNAEMTGYFLSPSICEQARERDRQKRGGGGGGGRKRERERES